MLVSNRLGLNINESLAEHEQGAWALPPLPVRQKGVCARVKHI